MTDTEPDTDAGPAATPVPVAVFVADEQEQVVVDAERLARLAREVLAKEGVSGPAELTLSFVDEDHIAELNAEYLAGDGPTDVLAFPLDDIDEDPSTRGPGPALLGDIVVCPSVAARYATERGRAVEDELALLVVHGVLHVLGHDHAESEEATTMRQAEHDHLTGLWNPSWTWGADEASPSTSS